MFRKYLSNTNEISTIHILQNILKLNKALDTPKNPKLYKIPRHSESYDTCMKY